MLCCWCLFHGSALRKRTCLGRKRHDANGATLIVFHPLSRTPGQSCAMLCFGLADLDHRDSTDFDLLAFVESGTCSSTRQRTNRNPIQNQIDSHHSCREKNPLVNKYNNGISPMFNRKYSFNPGPFSSQLNMSSLPVCTQKTALWTMRRNPP